MWLVQQAGPRIAGWIACLPSGRDSSHEPWLAFDFAHSRRQRGEIENEMEPCHNYLTTDLPDIRSWRFSRSMVSNQNQFIGR